MTAVGFEPLTFKIDLVIFYLNILCFLYKYIINAYKKNSYSTCPTIKLRNLI